MLEFDGRTSVLSVPPCLTNTVSSRELFRINFGLMSIVTVLHSLSVEYTAEVTMNKCSQTSAPAPDGTRISLGDPDKSILKASLHWLDEVNLMRMRGRR